MSTGSSSLKWGRIVIGVIVGLLITVVGYLVAQLLWGVVLGFQMRGNPPREALIAAFTSMPFQVVYGLLALLGGILGGRTAARPADTNRPIAGLITGIIVGLLVVAWRFITWGSVDPWGILYGVLAIIGGWIGAKLAARKPAEEYDEAPSL